jgi:hypothetical protein
MLDSYLAEVTAGLSGPARARTEILAELRAGLLDAVDAYRLAGLPPADAARVAIGEFGDPRLVADGFGPELAARIARRTALALVTTGPMVGALWAAAAAASHIGIREALPWQWANSPPVSPVAFPLAAAALAVTVWAALLTVAATGRLTRWLPARPRLAPTTAAVAGLGTAAADLIIFALLASQLAAAPRTLAPIPIAVAATASLIRLTMARRSARRCLNARAALS